MGCLLVVEGTEGFGISALLVAEGTPSEGFGEMTATTFGSFFLRDLT